MQVNHVVLHVVHFFRTPRVSENMIFFNGQKSKIDGRSSPAWLNWCHYKIPPNKYLRTSISSFSNLYNKKISGCSEMVHPFRAFSLRLLSFNRSFTNCRNWFSHLFCIPISFFSYTCSYLENLAGCVPYDGAPSVTMKHGLNRAMALRTSTRVPVPAMYRYVVQVSEIGHSARAILFLVFLSLHSNKFLLHTKLHKQFINTNTHHKTLHHMNLNKSYIIENLITSFPTIYQTMSIFNF